MRILHVTDSYLPTLGGIELHVRDLALVQRRCGHDARVLSRTDPQGRSGLADATSTPALAASTLRELAADVVHVHGSVWSPLAWAAVRACTSTRTPVVYTSHSLLTGFEQVCRVAARLNHIADLPVVWTAVSGAAAQSLRAAVGVRDVRVLPNAVQGTWWRAADVAPRSTSPVFVAVMRFARRKRPWALLRSFADGTATTTSQLVLIGDGPLMGGVARWVERHPGTRVELPGALNRDEIRSRLWTADAFLAPATRESFGIAALEAHEAGLPVIGRAGTGLTEFIHHGTDGLLVGSDHEFARAVHRLAVDVPLRRRLAAAAAVPSGLSWAAAAAAAWKTYAAAADRAAESALQAKRWSSDSARELTS